MGDAINSIASIMENLSKTIHEAVFNGVNNLADPLISLLIVLAIIGIATNYEMFFGNGFNFGNLLIKVMQICFYIFLIRSWNPFVGMILASCEKMGMVAGGSEEVLSMGTIIDKGVGTAFNYLSHFMESAKMDLSYFGVILLGYIMILIIIFAYFKIAYTLFIVKNEFIIIGGLSVILLPFAMTKWTQGISEKPWGALLTAGMKVMVAFFMIALLSQYIQDAFAINANVDDVKTIAKDVIPTLMEKAIGIFFISYLFGKVVDFAGAIANGLNVGHINIVNNMGSAVYGAHKRGVTTVVSGATRGAWSTAQKVGGKIRDYIKNR